MDRFPFLQGEHMSVNLWIGGIPTNLGTNGEAQLRLSLPILPSHTTQPPLWALAFHCVFEMD